MSKPTICLTMFVRDEEPLIRRCLESFKPLIDTWLIIDTGSEDRTCEVIEETMQGIPGQLLHREWTDHATVGNEAIQLARPLADYLIICDADHTVEQVGDWELDGGELYMVKERYRDTLEHLMPRIISTRKSYYWKGVTHCFLDCHDGPQPAKRLNGLVFTHHNDGTARPTKFDRDADLLERAVAENPNDGRSVFYLAQTYRCQGRHEEAAVLYELRAMMGGWPEEVFWSVYQRGMILLDLDFPKAVATLLGAYEYRPHRAEPLRLLAEVFAHRGQPQVAELFRERADRIPYPEHDTLFVQPNAYPQALAAVAA